MRHMGFIYFPYIAFLFVIFYKHFCSFLGATVSLWQRAGVVFFLQILLQNWYCQGYHNRRLVIKNYLSLAIDLLGKSKEI